MRCVLTGREMAEVDRYTIEVLGIPGIVLMENAGRETALIIDRKLREMGMDREGAPVTVVCGKGNNGGDGFVVARYLTFYGYDVVVHLLGSKEEVKGDAKTALAAYENTCADVIEHEEIIDRALEADLTESVVVVDAIFGTGLSKEVTGIHLEAIQLINDYSPFTVSVDIPSGVDSNTGKIMGDCVEADLTVTFNFWKVGHVVTPGCTYCGEIILADVGFPPDSFNVAKPGVWLVEDLDLFYWLEEREPDFHKGDAGRVFVVGGSKGMTGAVVMACEGALAAGSGLIYAVVPSSLNDIFEVKMTEQLTIPVDDGGKGHFLKESAEEVIEYLKRAHAVAVGPGLSWRNDTAELVYELVRRVTVPMVIDADGINVISENPDVLLEKKADIILTPHEMEMARLLRKDVEDISGNRVEAAREAARRWGVIVLLKGYRTIIASPKGRVFVNPTGNPYMATGGMGDVLTGIILSYLGQGLDPIGAACAGAYMHGLAGDIVVRRYPRTPVAPRHIVAYYPDAIRYILGGHPGEERSGEE
ncbi:MAG: NAD(P)H-hydrate dehydratase [Deltaproteobacteria bacterium]|nr:MAG: NAD(P)H-hydrate dehydratase [Deltaproteobacteria bacterium]